MEGDSVWIAARRIPGCEWQDVHKGPVTRDRSKEIVEQFRVSEAQDADSSALQWQEARDGSLAALDGTYEYRIASIEMWMGTSAES